VSHLLLGMKLDPTSYTEATNEIIAWAKASECHTVCAASAHMVLESFDSCQVRTAINSIDLVVSDGMPLVWWLRSQGVKNQQRVYGPSLMLHVCQAAASGGIPIGLYGSTQEVITALVRNLQFRFPHLHIDYIKSPPFRTLNSIEDDEDVRQINASGIKILFVGLGCPKQEIWITEHKNRVQAVMIAIGAAFQFHAGLVKQAPVWIQKLGFEWLFRLTQEPKRLWKRYAEIVPRFLFLITREFLFQKFGYKKS
jgi:N-acetylglucosaminyldiphosphoundecaprenol N-acetyl-beta-D-mannosaminyltransferase